MRRKSVFLTCVVVAAIILSGAVAVLLSQVGYVDHQFTIKPGDYVKYHEIENSGEANVTETVLGVNGTNFFCRETNENMVGQSFFTYYNATLNQTVFGFDPAHCPSAMWGNVTFIGQENLAFSWGTRTADKYNSTDATGHQNYLWVRNGVVVKEMQWDVSGYITLILVDSNMTQVM